MVQLRSLKEEPRGEQQGGKDGEPLSHEMEMAKNSQTEAFCECQRRNWIAMHVFDRVVLGVECGLRGGTSQPRGGVSVCRCWHSSDLCVCVFACVLLLLPT